MYRKEGLRQALMAHGLANTFAVLEGRDCYPTSQGKLSEMTLMCAWSRSAIRSSSCAGLEPIRMHQ